ncbi:MAG: hypothetical protein J1E29_04805 [Duncaniella sp.]|nr:hypothetical protein [Duncaniella sp.]
MHRHLISILFGSLLSLVAISSVSAKNIDDDEVSRILNRLDKELTFRDARISERRQRIDSLKSIERSVDNDSLRLSTLLGLADNYYAFDTDSAVWFYRHGFSLARKSGSDSIAMRFALRLSRTLPLLLFFRESRQIVDSVAHQDVPLGLLAEQADAERQMHFYIANFFTDYPSVFDSISALQLAAQDRLLKLLPNNTGEYKLNLAEAHFSRGEFSRAKVISETLLAETSEYSHLYARASHLMAHIALRSGEMNEYLYYLALSAISDSRCATLEVASLQELGKTLYGVGDVDRAYEYLSVALSNAVDCHATLRILETSRTLPLIESAHKEKLRRSRLNLYVVITVLVCLLIFLAASFRAIINRNRRLNTLTLRLTDASRIKDLYIGQFLNLCSIYMDKLNQFSKTVYHKLSAGKVDDLMRMTKSGKLVEEQSKEFYEVFDDAFLHLYPTFVDEVNLLLDPDKQIELKDNEKLNADLRILALMRLGVDDSSRIAQMLNYSVNTIYTYRNKFKSRAINRDTFEADVMAIRSESVK